MIKREFYELRGCGKVELFMGGCNSEHTNQLVLLIILI